MGFFNIKGVIPPVITPFKENGQVDFEAFEKNILKWNDTGLSGYLILGSNGETPYIRETDKLKLVEIAKKNAAKDKYVFVGTGLESTGATIELTNKMAALGADATLVLTPGFFKDQMDEQALTQYYTQVADNSAIPVLIYNATKFTGVNIPAGAVSKLSQHPNIIGMKDSAGNIAQFMSFYTAGLADEFNMILGSASTWYPSLTIGIKTGIMALANCCPAACVQVQTLFEAGNYEASFALYKRLFPVNACVTGKLGVAALKYACTRLSYEGGSVCAPLLPLTAAQKKSVDDVLQKAELI